MLVQFTKYQGTGNDFIILDNRTSKYSYITNDQVRRLCDRRLGIGSDGLMLLNDKKGYDFEMRYYNADGGESSMCGNGGRCIVKFAYQLGIHRSEYKFLAVDGEHEAEIETDENVSLRMIDVDSTKKVRGDFILNTGSPHYVKIVTDVMDLDVYKRGRDIRYSKDYEIEGINVNFVEQTEEDKIIVRTYERGVEDETYSCGTGVVASALVCYHNENGFNDVIVKTLGGSLNVEFDRLDDDKFANIWLTGPAEKVFEGIVEI
jgi:diaminopimelate epimerase